MYNKTLHLQPEFALNLVPFVSGPIYFFLQASSGPPIILEKGTDDKALKALKGSDPFKKNPAAASMSNAAQAPILPPQRSGPYRCRSRSSMTFAALVRPARRIVATAGNRCSSRTATIAPIWTGWGRRRNNMTALFMPMS